MTDSIIKFLQFVTTLDYSGISVLLMLVILLGFLIRAHFSKTSAFFFDKLFLNDFDRPSISQIAIVISLILSAWAFVFLTLKGLMTTGYFMGFLSVWVVQSGYSKWMDSLKIPKMDDVKNLFANGTPSLDDVKKLFNIGQNSS